MNEAWKNFNEGKWTQEINVEDFIINNYTEYRENHTFLAPISNKTKKVWNKCLKLLQKEFKNGVLDIE